jgi:hypothetical protein
MCGFSKIFQSIISAFPRSFSVSRPPKAKKNSRLFGMSLQQKFELNCPKKVSSKKDFEPQNKNNI